EIEMREQADGVNTRGRHRDNLVRARHAAEDNKMSKQKRYRQEDHHDLRNLGGVKFQHPPKIEVLIKIGRNAVADIEDEPDRYEPDDAVKVSLQEISGNISIK